jgi:hypothetical protein
VNGSRIEAENPRRIFAAKHLAASPLKDRTYRSGPWLTDCESAG